MKEPRLRCIVNAYGRGPANAIRFGIDAAAAPVAVVTMADGCDDPRQIDDLARLVGRGVAVAAASRYMPGGQQVGGPVLKGLLSKAAAGRSGCSPASAPGTPPTRLRPTRQSSSRGRHRLAGRIRDRHRARRQGAPDADAVAEIPTIWLDRQAGVSNFKIAKWIPNYFRWYRFAFGPRLTAEQVKAYGQRVGKETGQHMRRFWSPARPDSSPATSSRSCSAAATTSSASTTSPSTGRSPVLRQPPGLPLRRGRRQGRGADDAAARRLRPLRRRRGDHRWHLALPQLAYDLIAENERITAAAFDAAIEAHKNGRLRKITFCRRRWSTRAHRVRRPRARSARSPPPLSTYGFQKLATEYFAKAAWEQYKLPYTIVRPFNCVGIGERRALGDEESSRATSSWR